MCNKHCVSDNRIPDEKSFRMNILVVFNHILILTRALPTCGVPPRGILKNPTVVWVFLWNLRLRVVFFDGKVPHFAPWLVGFLKAAWYFSIILTWKTSFCLIFLSFLTFCRWKVLSLHSVCPCVYVEATKHGSARAKATSLCKKSVAWYFLVVFDALFSSIYHEIPPWDVGFSPILTWGGPHHPTSPTCKALAEMTFFTQKLSYDLQAGFTKIVREWL